MTDIVQTLRDIYPSHPLIAEAANTIEHLRTGLTIQNRLMNVDAVILRRMERAERALIRAGWTYTEGAEEWKPPVLKMGDPLPPFVTEVYADPGRCSEHWSLAAELGRNAVLSEMSTMPKNACVVPSPIDGKQ